MRVFVAEASIRFPRSRWNGPAHGPARPITSPRQSLTSLAATPSAIAVAGACAGLGHGFTFPILSGLVVERARTAERGAATSIFTALFDAGALVGGPLLGAIIRDVGYSAMFLTAAALVTVGGAAFAVVDRRH